VILTVTEIRHLAMFAGLIVSPPAGTFAEDESEEKITVSRCPKGGLFDEETKTYYHYKHIAYLTEYPEEGMCPLGPEVKPDGKETK